MLCPLASHPHVERRYLIVPGLRSSRIYVIDTKPDPREPRIIKTIEPLEVFDKAGYSRPHTVHCGPDGIYMSALGAPDGDGPGGVFVLDHQSFVELRPAHDPTMTYGFAGVVIDTTNLESSFWLWHRGEGGNGSKAGWEVQKVITIPPEPADPDQLPPALKPFSAVPPLVSDI